ncbi:oxidoreductase [Aspergillus steynii IBT 23096]|uniref:Oxidoreductase n=1 Tax=Aspergillus steynii IBT 23096 TaxID=1392250 RepID=A0A2I2G084_9EURO|nr:oxidoreductase [Aspergillus steynii IBT 23096]PLB46302.1 oxidoreductase [Aspergillus steynii IBT 23096]
MSVKGRETKSAVGGAHRSIQDLFGMDERTVLITGGGGAMGLEAARTILETGGDVICLDRQDEPLVEPWKTVEETASRHATKAWYFRCDISDDEHVRATVATAVSGARFPLRGLLCCAGISGEAPSIEYPVQGVRRVMDVNVAGTFACAQAAAREIRKHGLPGSMVLIASMSAHGSNKGIDTAAYNASKAAIVQLVRSLAAEWGSRVDIPLIRVNSISPGYIRTRMTVDSLAEPGMEERWTQDNMLMRLSEAHEYRGAILYLLSDASSFVTGADLRVDGGHTAW